MYVQGLFHLCLFEPDAKQTPLGPTSVNEEINIDDGTKGTNK